MNFCIQKGMIVASFNRVIMMGNLTRDPEHKQLASGQAVCRLGLASNRQFKNKNTGQMIQEVCFVDIDVWGAQADSCNQYLQKGRSILVEGRLKLDTWTDNEGQRKSKHSIVADRVTFLAAAAQTDMDVSPSLEPAKVAPKKQEAVAPAVTAESAVPEQNSVGEMKVKDEAPFEDDLPF